MFSSASTLDLYMGPTLAILGIYAEELFMMGASNGDLKVYWRCFKSRWNPFLVDRCGALDEHGNPIEVLDPGPWVNFVHNTFDWVKDKDVDGDGDEENLWERFVLSLEATAVSVHDFIDDSDGAGFKENMKQYGKNLYALDVQASIYIGEHLMKACDKFDKFDWIDACNGWDIDEI